jgi:hypothetical protein
MTEEEKQLLQMKESINRILNDKRSIHAPCENAYMEKGRDGHTTCYCWRCTPEEPGR